MLKAINISFLQLYFSKIKLIFTNNNTKIELKIIKLFFLSKTNLKFFSKKSLENIYYL